MIDFEGIGYDEFLKEIQDISAGGFEWNLEN